MYLKNHLETAQIGVEKLPEAMVFLSDLFGPYPFLNEQYGMTQLGFYGAIENQTNTIQNSLSSSWFLISVHELAHMWFADMITCSSWNHGWVNEGFATYSEALWREYDEGVNAYHNEMASIRFINGGTVFLEDDNDPFQVFVSIIYNKGAWVLHMLRNVMGDELFFQALNDYATNNTFMYANASTQDFQAVCEDVLGEDLDYFFEQWIYDEYYPKYEYNYETNSANQETGIVITQTQNNEGWREIFTMPIDVLVRFYDGTEITETVFNDQLTQTWYFTFEKEVDTILIDPVEWILRDVEFNPDFSVNVETHIFENSFIYPNPSNSSITISNKVKYHSYENTLILKYNVSLYL